MNTLDSIIIEFDIVTHSQQLLNLDTFHFDFQNKDKIYWIHCNLHESKVVKKILSHLKLPDEVSKLMNQTDTMPKLIDSDESITMQIQCLRSSELSKIKDQDFGNLILHLTHQYCLTATSEENSALFEFAKSYPKATRYAKTPCFILFLILDNVINDFAKILFNFELITDQLDLDSSPKTGPLYKEINRVKKQVMKVKRYSVAVREILMRISGRKIAVISEQCRVSLYNLFNQSHMVFHEADSIRDILNSLLSQIDNLFIQKLNETMRVLTAFAAIFLPLTLITGIYGMNFHKMPELEWKYGYLYALTLILVCAIVLLLIFRKKKWF